MEKRSVAVSRVRLLARTGEARRIRERSLLSVGEIAREIGVSASSLSRWETGTTTPRASVALRWAEVLEQLERGMAGASR